jgi:hypothetical protein
MMKKHLELYCNTVTFISILLIGNKFPVMGFTVNVVGSILWIIYGNITNQRGFIIYNIGYLILALMGINNYYGMFKM